MTFQVDISFCSKVPDILYMAFNLVKEHCSVVFIVGLRLVLEKNRPKHSGGIISCTQVEKETHQ